MAIKKQKLLTMKVDEEEKERWKKLASDRGLSLAELIRRKLDDLPPPPPVKKKKPKQIIEVDPKLLFEVNAIGNNLNQIARRLNQGEKFEVLPILYSIEKNLAELIDAHKAP